MSVLVEGISVVMKKATVEKKYKGGFAQYSQDCPNATLCFDDDLVRIGFLTTEDVRHYVQMLERHGFVFIKDEKFVDLAIVDQLQGVTKKCNWLQFFKHPDGYSMCCLNGADPGELAVPAGWKLEDSLSTQFKVVTEGEVNQKLEFLRHEEGVDVFLDKETGNTVYVGRPLGITYEVTQSNEIFRKAVELVSPYIFPSDVTPENPYPEKVQKDINEGIAYLQEAVKLHPGNWQAYWYLGKVFQAIQNNHYAYQNFKSAYEINPHNEEVCRELMKECLELGKTREGVSVAQNAVKLNPGDSGLLSNLALALLLDAQLKEAGQVIERAIELNPNDIVSQNVRMIISEIKKGKRKQPRKFSDL